MKTCKVCVVSAVQESFWGSQKKEYQNKYLPEMKKLAQEIGFELCYVEEPLSDAKKSENAKAVIEEMNPDFLLIQVSTFAAGEILIPLAELGIRIGLWAIPEIVDGGAIANNSLCGINMYASILNQYLGFTPKYKWFYGECDDEMFVERLKITVNAIAAIKHLNNAKIGLIGGIAPGFYDFSFDERIALEKLGVKIDRQTEFDDVKNKALSYTLEDIKPILEDMAGEYVSVASDLKNKHIEMSARVYKALLDIKEDKGFDAIAIGCWPKYRSELGIVVCSVIGRLLENGIIAACEGDVDSAISMMLLKDLTGSVPMLMDFSKFDESDESILMWHCGSAPKSYADDKGTALEGHYKPGSRITCQDDLRVVGTNDMYFKSNKITVARLTNNYKNMLSFTGEFVEKKDRSYDGSRGWVGKLKSDNKNIPIRTFVNTIMSQGYQHHYPIVKGDVQEEIFEIMAWLDIGQVEFLDYRNYLQNPTMGFKNK